MNSSVEHFRRSLLRARDRVEQQNRETVNQFVVKGSIDPREAYRTNILIKMRNQIRQMKKE
ncbi:hypothetical protein [Pseudomonas oryziphila]|uniref:Uncharacterized protein n=1 Tax=Pseudomonas oryziphila TaxID=2894079 RepID=A0ABM7CWD9_9PSED|nr:hypothetical protein [Pseudomonas oryziphila]AZL75783.1 hypothetical protein EI693_22930 [Pseudomonas oryziphila]